MSIGVLLHYFNLSFKCFDWPDHHTNLSQKDKFNSRGMIVIPYVKGLCKRIAHVMKKRISTAMQPHTTHRNLCAHPNDMVESREGVYGM